MRTQSQFKALFAVLALASIAALSLLAAPGLAQSALLTPTPTLPPTPAPPIFFDDFETDKGWVVNPNRTDTATSGKWERGDPEATSYNGPKQLGSTPSGRNDLVTGRRAGSSAGSYDIDGGVSSIRSPAIRLPTNTSLALTFTYYLAHASNVSSADYLRVKIVGSSTTTVFEQLGETLDRDAVWTSAVVNLDSYAGQTVWVLIEAADVGGASLVEAAIDDLAITAQQRNGLRIHGSVRLNSSTGAGLANVRICRSFAAYQGAAVATTDVSGAYASGFQYIPGQETVNVWPQLDGYTFAPRVSSWIHYPGFEIKTIDFVASPNPSASYPSCGYPPSPGITPSPGLPDLIVADIRYDGGTPQPCGYPPDNGTQVVVKNIGQAHAGPFVVQLNGAQQTVNGGLPAGQSTSLLFLKLHPMSATATVDTSNQVIESNENNNTLSKPLPVPTPPLPCTTTPTSAPTVTPTASPTPTRIPLTGDLGWKTIIGSVYEQVGSSPMPIEGATITCTHSSLAPRVLCSGTRTTASDGTFSFGSVFLHDTDRLTVRATLPDGRTMEITRSGVETQSNPVFRFIFGATTTPTFTSTPTSVVSPGRR